jgi:hypothetical protein
MILFYAIPFNLHEVCLKLIIILNHSHIDWITAFKKLFHHFDIQLDIMNIIHVEQSQILFRRIITEIQQLVKR